MSTRRVRLGALALFISMVLAAWPGGHGAAQAEPNWTRWGTAQFPARVRALAFSGHVLDRSHGMCWGRWCVNFGARAVLAKFTTLINISPLSCRNKAVGTKHCSISLIRESGGICAIHINSTESPKSAHLKLISIKCPHELRLE